MKKLLIPIFALVVIFSGIFAPANCYGQSQKAVINKYLKELPGGKAINDGKLQKYRMMAVYTNRDLYGNFTNKLKYPVSIQEGLKMVTLSGTIFTFQVQIISPNHFLKVQNRNIWKTSGMFLHPI